jgi:alginate O-acetyltransferase complex protein AlgI
LLFGFVSVRLLRAHVAGAFVPVVIGVLAFIWLKKYAFLPSSIFLHYPYVTLGLSYIFFRVLHLIIDSSSRYSTLPDKISFVSYLNYTLNFTTLVSGPIQRYKEFAGMQLAPDPLPLNIGIAGQALNRIVVGFFKVNVLSLFLSMIHAGGLSSLSSEQTARQRVLSGLVIAVVYPFYLYCNFSDYIDIVIGIARFLRLQLPKNFNRPFFSENYMIFWNRWHITFDLDEDLRLHPADDEFHSKVAVTGDRTVLKCFCIFRYFFSGRPVARPNLRFYFLRCSAGPGRQPYEAISGDDGAMDWRRAL